MVNCKDYIQLVRPHQFIKNSFLFLPLLFGDKLFDLGALCWVSLGFVCFCLAGASVYVFNDIQDVEDDRRHPVKKNRPLASGKITIAAAWRLAPLLAATAFFFSLFLGSGFMLVLAGYLVLNSLYSMGLKHYAIVDITCISTGFVMRVYAGACAANVSPSHWIVIMTFLLAMFLALAKRRDDVLLAMEGEKTRKSLDGYNLEMISAAMMIMAAVTIVCYIMYAVSPEVIAYHKSKMLYLSTLWVILGILRYLQVTFVHSNSGSPSKVLLQDPFLITTICCWLTNILFLKYVLSM